MPTNLPMLHAWYIGMLVIDKVFGSIIQLIMLAALTTLVVLKYSSRLCYNLSVWAPPEASFKVEPSVAVLLV